MVTGLLVRPPEAAALFVFGHGAGAGMRHPFMEAVAGGLAARGVATFRYHFPYMEAGRRVPDPTPSLVDTVRSAVAEAGRLEPRLPLFSGGKSMGGRMASLAVAGRPSQDLRGLVFVGFPLHPAGKPSIRRADHLSSVALPMLFLQGTRDRLADLDLLRPVVDGVASSARRGGWTPPTLHVVEGADHGFQVLRRSGRTGAEVVDELCARMADWMADRVTEGVRS